MVEPDVAPRGPGSPPGSRAWAGERGERWCANLARMEGMLAPLNAPLVDALVLDRSCRVADVGCGGGATTFEILRRAPRGSTVRGYDISPALVEAARARWRTQGTDPAIAFEVADVATAPLPAERCDRLVSRLGILFFDDPPAAFASLARWLAPAGRLAFAAWGDPAGNPWFTTVRDVVSDIVPLPPLYPGGPGPFRYAEAGTLLALLERAGLRELRVTPWRGTLSIGGGLAPDEAARFALTSFSRFGEALAAAGGSAVAEAQRALEERLARHVRQGVVRLDAAVHVFTGVAGPAESPRAEAATRPARAARSSSPR